MDVDGLLNFEKRTGIKDSDIDDFTRKASEVEAAIKGLMDGTIKPEDVKIEGVEMEEEKKQKELEREEKRLAYLKKEEELKQQRKLEEKERWWNAVEVFFPRAASSIAAGQENKDDKEAVTDKKQQLSRYTADYSKWDTWTPTDAVSIQEQEEVLAQEEKKKNEEFEKNNPAFCSQFVADMSDRQANTTKKQESADSLRTKGNKWFTEKRDYGKAYECYMEALKMAPFDKRLLMNIVQVYIKQKNYPDALEFISRLLYLDDRHVKALSRQAFILTEQGLTTEALAAIQQALVVEPSNHDLLIQREEIVSLEGERKKEAMLLKQQQQQHGQGQSLETLAAATAKVGSSPQQKIDALKALLCMSLEKEQQGEQQEQLQSLDSLLLELIAIFTSTTSMTSATKVEEMELLRTYFRTSQTLVSFLTYTITLLTNYTVTTATVDDKQEVTVDVLGHSLQLLSLVLLGERSSKMILFDHPGKVWSHLKQLLASLLLAADDKKEQQMLTNALLAVFSTIYLDTAMPTLPTNIAINKAAVPSNPFTSYASKVKIFLLQDSEFIDRLSQLLGTIAASVTAAVAASATLQLDHSLPMLITLVKILHLVLDQQQQQQPSTVSFNEDKVQRMLMLMMGGVGSSWYSLSTIPKTATIAVAASVEELFLALLAILMKLSTLASYRTMLFSMPIPVAVAPSTANAAKKEMNINDMILQQPSKQPSKQTKQTKQQPVVVSSSIISALQSEHSSNLLAICMNASIEPSTASAAGDNTAPSVRDAIYQAGGLSLALAGLNTNKATIVEEDDDQVLLTCRQIGLLSRLVHIPAVQQQLLGLSSSATSTTSTTATSDSSYYSQLCQRFVQLSHSRQQLKQQSVGANKRRWLEEELQHLLRIFGSFSLTNLTAAHKQIACQAGLMEALLACFPSPRLECGEITPTSVILMPMELQTLTGTAKQSMISFLGNTARCLLLFADDLQCAERIFLKEKNLGIEKLICMMASISEDIRVRRNIAIVLAKGCKVGGEVVKEKIRHFRGLQMMVELQDKL